MKKQYKFDMKFAGYKILILIKWLLLISFLNQAFLVRLH